MSMIKAIINYPNSTITIHSNSRCPFCQNSTARLHKINNSNYSVIINLLKNIPFKSVSGYNNLHIELDFDDAVFEQAALEYIKKNVLKNYSPITKAKITTHC